MSTLVMRPMLSTVSSIRPFFPPVGVYFSLYDRRRDRNNNNNNNNKITSSCGLYIIICAGGK